MEPVRKLLYENHHYDINIFKKDFIECQGILNDFDPQFSQHKYKWYRAPYGIMTKEMATFVKEQNVSSILGDVYGCDPNFEGDPDYIANYILTHVRPGSVIILHMPSQDMRYTNLEVLRIILPKLTQVFHLVTLSDLAKIEHRELQTKSTQN